MKLLRYGQPGQEKPGILLDDQLFGVPAFGQDYDPSFLASGGLAALAAYVQNHPEQLVPLPAGERLGPPVAQPSKIVCIGLNYADHVRETAAVTPAEPVLFLKSTTALVGPNDNIQIPRGSTKTDWEVELAVVIGQRASYVDEADALAYVAGYVLHNDVSEREYQLERGGTWDKGKGCDTFAPLGPYLVTPDEIPDVNKLRLWLSVNGHLRQDGNTADLIFKIPFLVAYVSQFMTLLPGDIISTGTPAGVGLGFQPPVYLRPGDVVELGVDGLGRSRQLVQAYAKP